MTQDFNSSRTFCENLSQLKNNELHSSLQNRVAEERKLTHQILLLIVEIDQRKLYLPMACSSLFDYLVKLIGYTPASAQRRIDAARMMLQVPELGGKIEDGSLKLTQVSQVQQALRLVQKKYESELILAQEFNLPLQSSNSNSG